MSSSASARAGGTSRSGDAAPRARAARVAYVGIVEHDAAVREHELTLVAVDHEPFGGA